MDTNELLSRIKERDMDAYLQLTQNYGWKLYSHVRTKFDDREMAEAAFNETLTSFYNAIAGGDGDDAVESLLLAYSDLICRKMQQGDEGQQSPLITLGEPQPQPVQDPSEPDPVEQQKEQTSRKSGGFGFGLGVVILVIGMLVALWVIVGLLMDMNILPELDLGYSWFNANIAPWF